MRKLEIGRHRREKTHSDRFAEIGRGREGGNAFLLPGPSVFSQSVSQSVRYSGFPPVVLPSPPKRNVQTSLAMYIHTPFHSFPPSSQTTTVPRREGGKRERARELPHHVVRSNTLVRDEKRSADITSVGNPRSLHGLASQSHRGEEEQRSAARAACVEPTLSPRNREREKKKVPPLPTRPPTETKPYGHFRRALSLCLSVSLSSLLCSPLPPPPLPPSIHPPTPTNLPTCLPSYLTLPPLPHTPPPPTRKMPHEPQTALECWLRAIDRSHILYS